MIKMRLNLPFVMFFVIAFISFLPAQSKLLTEQDLASALIAAQTDDDRARILSAERDLLTPKLCKVIWDTGDQQRLLGNYPQALKIFQLSYDVAEEINDRKGEADSLWGLGMIQRLQGDYDPAMKSFEQSLAIYDSLDDQIGIANSWHNIGVIHFRQGEYELAMDFYKKSLVLKEKIGYKAGMPTSMSVIGDYYYWQGNYSLAMQYWQKSLALRKSLGDKNGIPNSLNDIAAIYYSQGNYALAVETYQQVWKLYDRVGNKIGVGVAMHNLGETLYRQGNYSQALWYLKKALTLREELGDKPQIPSTLETIGDVYFAQGNSGVAQEYLQKCLTVAEELGDKGQIALTLYDIARVFYQQRKYENALDFAERAANIAIPISNLETVWNAENIRGKAYLALGQTRKAQQAFESAVATVENLRSQSAGGEEEQQELFEGKVSPYYSIAALLIQEGKNEDALAYSERAKARVLLDVLRGGRFNIDKVMTTEERRNESELKRQLVSLSVHLQEEANVSPSDPDKLNELNAQLGSARLNYEAFRIGLYAKHPKLQAQRGEVQSATAVETAELLRDETTAILEYLITDEKAYLFVLTKRTGSNGLDKGNPPGYELRTYNIPVSRKELSHRIESFRSQLANRDPRFATLARDLYLQLVAPASTQLERAVSLIIIPDDILWKLPFQCLQLPDKDYLIEKKSVSYAPSLTVLREMLRLKRDRQSETTAGIFAMGNPEMNGTGKQVQEELRGKSLEPLPGTEIEVRELVSLYGQNESKIYVGKDATEDRMKKESSRFGILHFATHGIFDNASPMYSNIVLARAADANEDGFLEAWEILGMDLNAWLVVLSACETARGKIGSGEGIIGLTWAFFVAGVPTTLVSQWKVESQSTAEIMLQFHRNLKQIGMSSATALQDAELKLLRNRKYRHPFYWASFVIVGDGSRGIL